jgi:hypothetical protein
VVLWSAVVAGGLGACNAPPELRPDQVLRDSLGLTDRDRVHVVRLSTTESGVDVASPPETVLRAGDLVTFDLADRRPRTVRFATMGLDTTSAAWAEAAGLHRAPFLADSGARWVIDFSDAPAGRFPFTVVGGAEPGDGVIVVVAR